MDLDEQDFLEMNGQQVLEYQKELEGISNQIENVDEDLSELISGIVPDSPVNEEEVDVFTLVDEWEDDAGENNRNNHGKGSVAERSAEEQSGPIRRLDLVDVIFNEDKGVVTKTSKIVPVIFDLEVPSKVSPVCQKEELPKCLSPKADENIDRTDTVYKTDLEINCEICLIGDLWANSLGNSKTTLSYTNNTNFCSYYFPNESLSKMKTLISSGKLDHYKTIILSPVYIFTWNSVPILVVNETLQLYVPNRYFSGAELVSELKIFYNLLKHRNPSINVILFLPPICNFYMFNASVISKFHSKKQPKTAFKDHRMKAGHFQKCQIKLRKILQSVQMKATLMGYKVIRGQEILESLGSELVRKARRFMTDDAYNNPNFTRGLINGIFPTLPFIETFWAKVNELSNQLPKSASLENSRSVKRSRGSIEDTRDSYDRDDSRTSKYVSRRVSSRCSPPPKLARTVQILDASLKPSLCNRLGEKVSSSSLASERVPNHNDILRQLKENVDAALYEERAASFEGAAGKFLDEMMHRKESFNINLSRKELKELLCEIIMRS